MIPDADKRFFEYLRGVRGFGGMWNSELRDREIQGEELHRETYVKEVFIAPETLSQGSTWDVAFSEDAAQKFLYLADGQNMKVHIIDRASMEVLTTFGDGGRQPGLFFAVHSIATDSKGNIYTTETYEGKRLQKFVNKGLQPVTSGNQGAPWPSS